MSQTSGAGPATKRVCSVGNVYNLDSCERLVRRFSDAYSGSSSFNSRRISELEENLRMSLRIFVAVDINLKVSFVNRVKFRSRFAVEGRKSPFRLRAESGCEFIELGR